MAGDDDHQILDVPRDPVEAIAAIPGALINDAVDAIKGIFGGNKGDEGQQQNHPQQKPGPNQGKGR